MNQLEKNSTFKISSIIKTSYQLYSDNFTMFFTISLIAFAINMVNISVINIGSLELNAVWTVLMPFINIIIMVLSLYYSFKIHVTLLLCISKRYKKIITNIKQNFKESNQLVWKYIGASILLGLIIFLPALIIALSFLSINNLIFRISFILLGSTITIYLFVHYFLGPIIKLFNPDIKNYFKYSKSIIHQHFWKVMILIFIAFIYLLPNIIYRYIIYDYRTMSVFHNMIVSSLNSLIVLFISPFLSGISIIMYYELMDKHSDIDPSIFSKKQASSTQNTKKYIFWFFILITITNVIKFIPSTDHNNIAFQLGRRIGLWLFELVFFLTIAIVLSLIFKKIKQKIVLIIGIIYLIINIALFISSPINITRTQNTEEKIKSLYSSVTENKRIIEEDITTDKYGDTSDLVQYTQDFFIELQSLLNDTNKNLLEIDLDNIMNDVALKDHDRIIDTRKQIKVSLEKIDEFTVKMCDLIEKYTENIKSADDASDFSEGFTRGFLKSTNNYVERLTQQHQLMKNIYISIDDLLAFVDIKRDTYEFLDNQLRFKDTKDSLDYNALVEQLNRSISTFQESLPEVN